MLCSQGRLQIKCRDEGTLLESLAGDGRGAISNRLHEAAVEERHSLHVLCRGEALFANGEAGLQLLRVWEDEVRLGFVSAGDDVRLAKGDLDGIQP